MTGNQIVVMIVDDDDSMRKAVRCLMKSYGFAVETFASAEEFFGSDRLAKTSCFILDIHMPGMNVLEMYAYEPVYFGPRCYVRRERVWDGWRWHAHRVEDCY